MAKRIAASELNHDNWDDEEPTEEAGTFKFASDEEMGRRIVKKAKRRISDGAVSKSPFAVFKGLGTMFNFPCQTNAFETISNGHENEKTVEIKAEPKDVASGSDCPSKTSLGDAPGKSFKPNSSDRTEFFHQLQCLNEGLLSWIKQHVDKNPYCILSPVFADYDRHVKDLEAKYAVDDHTEHKDEKKAESAVKMAEVSVKTTWPTFTDNAKMATRLLATKENEGTDDDVEEDEYVPPTNDAQAVNEEDAFYKKKCKLFYKKDSSFKEKGVGTLYLKPNSEKTQLVVRADTNLGLILLNINLTKNVPTAKAGKNNVTLVCTPFPPLDDKTDSLEPVTFLIRVKTSEDADELLAIMNEKKT